MNNRNRNSARKKALAISLAGAFLFFVSINGLNFLEFGSKKEVKKTDFNIKKIQRKTKSAMKRPKPKPKKQNTAQKNRLKPNLDFSALGGGLDLGLDLSSFHGGDSSLLGQDGDTVMTVDTVDVPPKIAFREAIPYPESAADQKVNGAVTVNLLVTQEGSVENVRLLTAEPEGIFEQAALDGVKSWLFEPARFQGKKVAVWVKQTIQFQVN